MPKPAGFLDSDENLFTTCGLAYYARFYGMDVAVTRYTRARSFTISPIRMIENAIDDAAARRQFERLSREAAAEAAAQWRYHRLTLVHLTDQRVLYGVTEKWSTTWNSIWYADVSTYSADPEKWGVAFEFEDDDFPFLLRGPELPAYAVAISYLTAGRESLESPIFASLANAIAPPLVDDKTLLNTAVPRKYDDFRFFDSY